MPVYESQKSKQLLVTLIAMHTHYIHCWMNGGLASSLCHTSLAHLDSTVLI